MLFLALYCATLFMLFKSETNNVKYFVAGLLSSLAYLTRYTGMTLIVFTIAFFVIEFLRARIKNQSKNQSYKFSPSHLLWYSIPVIFFISIWGIISFQKTGEFFYNKNFQNTAFTVHKPDDMSKDEV